MKVKDCLHKTKCEVNGCKNFADFSFYLKDDNRAGLNICKDCSKQLYEALLKVNVPKSVPAPFKNPKKIKAESNESRK